MLNGIAIMGLNGSGKSTLAHALAKKISYFEIDVEDYYFPEQKPSRVDALENRYTTPCAHLGEVPFSVARSKKQVETSIYRDIIKNPQFVISGVTMNWSAGILSFINIAFILDAPVEERVRRVRDREARRFGDRVCIGGDMYEQQEAFREIIANRDIQSVIDSAERLNCRMVELDGTRPVEENIETILKEVR